LVIFGSFVGDSEDGRLRYLVDWVSVDEADESSLLDDHDVETRVQIDDA
jgi:hypothetical protein